MHTNSLPSVIIVFLIVFYQMIAYNKSNNVISRISPLYSRKGNNERLLHIKPNLLNVLQKNTMSPQDLPQLFASEYPFHSRNPINYYQIHEKQTAFVPTCSKLRNLWYKTLNDFRKSSFRSLPSALSTNKIDRLIQNDYNTYNNVSTNLDNILSKTIFGSLVDKPQASSKEDFNNEIFLIDHFNLKHIFDHNSNNISDDNNYLNSAQNLITREHFDDRSLPYKSLYPIYGKIKTSASNNKNNGLAYDDETANNNNINRKLDNNKNINKHGTASENNNRNHNYHYGYGIKEIFGSSVDDDNNLLKAITTKTMSKWHDTPGEIENKKLREDTEEEDTIVLLDRRNNEYDNNYHRSSKLNQRNEKRDYKWPIANNNNNQLRYDRDVKKLARNYNYFHDYDQQRPLQQQLQQFYPPYDPAEESEIDIDRDYHNYNNAFKTLKEHENFQRYEPYPFRYKYNRDRRAEDDQDEYDENKNEDEDKYGDDDTDDQDDQDDDQDYNMYNNNREEDKNDFIENRSNLVQRESKEEEQETEKKVEEIKESTEATNEPTEKAKIEKTIETEEDEKETVENETEDEEKPKKHDKHKKNKDEDEDEMKPKRHKGLISKDSSIASALRKQFFQRNGHIYEGYVLSPYKQKVGKKIRRIDVIRDVIPSGYTIDDIGNTLAIN